MPQEAFIRGDGNSPDGYNTVSLDTDDVYI